MFGGKLCFLLLTTAVVLANGHCLRANLLKKIAPNSIRVSHYLNFDLQMPRAEEAIGPDVAVSAVAEHIAEIKEGRLEVGEAKAEYWRDYRKVLDSYSELSSAKPVFYKKEDGTELLARYLVGMRRDDKVYGFFTVDGKEGKVICELMWTPELRPLWSVSDKVWESSQSVNEIDELAELVPPLDQFTAGIPIDPHEANWTIIDGVVDELPTKTQEERREQVTDFNERHGKRLGVELKSKMMRRIATLKCMSVAASYAADWWAVRTGHQLGTYKNAVGGQQEYGFNPRVVESLFYKRRQEQNLFGRWIGNWKTAPLASDPVTGENVPFSPRGIARVLCETNSQDLKDPLVPSLLQYDIRDNHFYMDAKPVITQVFTSGVFPRNAIQRDIANAQQADFPYALPPNYGSEDAATNLKSAIDNWGPHLAQHMQRTMGGKSRTGLTGMGVHCCLIVGYGMYEDKLHFVYRETFGGGKARYLEDFFLGPEFRIMPAEYFYQAIGFPHHLYLKLEGLKTDLDAATVGTLIVSTNGGNAAISPDELRVYVDGELAEHARLREQGLGRYSLWIPIGTTAHSSRIEIRASKKYFANHEGKKWFGVAAERPNRKWQALKEQLSPINLEF